LIPPLLQPRKARIDAVQRLAVVGSRAAPHLQESEREILLDRQTRKNTPIFRYKTYALARDAVGILSVNAGAVQTDCVAGRLNPAGNGLQKSRLADAIAAKDDDNFALFH